MNLEELRTQIDEIDASLTALFVKRMRLSEQIAAYKQAHQIPVYDGARERELLARVSAQAGDGIDVYARTFFNTLFSLSRAYQHSRMGRRSELAQRIETAAAETPQLFPEQAVVACQGVEGAYSTQACEKLFVAPQIMYCADFAGVFAAVESGLCRYGILPLENSTAGSVNRIYDLMTAHNFYIVRSTRLQVCHALLANHGAKKEAIKTVYSHEQAISQCSAFLAELPGVEVKVCENTAEAAKMVAESGRTDVAAISSARCAEIYGLAILDETIQNSGANRTRFICISKKLEVYPGANRTSFMMVLPNKPGALFHILGRFYELGINLVKLESRPMPDRDFEFTFYFDIDASVYAPALSQLLCELEGQLEQFRYLGSYTELA